jgi:hypothetical protein
LVVGVGVADLDVVVELLGDVFVVVGPPLVAPPVSGPVVSVSVPPPPSVLPPSGWSVGWTTAMVALVAVFAVNAMAPTATIGTASASASLRARRA